MASYRQPNVQSYIALSAVERGDAVILDSSNNDQVEKATLNTSLSIGIALCAAAAGETVDVAMPGGGAVGRAGESISAGKLLVAGADGELFQTNTSGDRVIGMAMEDAVVNDIFAIEVVVAIATAADL